MDLLAGYDSGSDEDNEVVPQRPSAPQAPATSQAAQDIEPSLFTSLPAPKEAKPIATKRKLIKLKLPKLNVASSDDEDEHPPKKLKQSTAGLSLTDILPPPQHEPLGLGASSRLDTSDHEDEGGANDLEEWGKANMPQQPNNEAYRAADDFDATDPTVEFAGSVQPAGRESPGHSAHQNVPAEYGSQAASHQPAVVGFASGTEGDLLLQRALQEESEKAARRQGGPSHMPMHKSVQFKEVRQEALTHMDATQREALNATRTAFGSDYEVKLRQEAGPVPNKLAKRKHQLNTLYHQAKLQELEHFDQRSQGLKTKAETRAKYGW